VTIRIIPITGMPIITNNDRLSNLIYEAAEKQEIKIKNNDIIIITHVVVSRSEGYTIDLDTVNPSKLARLIAKKTDKDPALVEVILKESQRIIRIRKGNLITFTKHGFICANSGVDKSNVPGNRTVALLPKNPDKSAQQIRQEIRKITGNNVAIVISDTHGRPLRDGEINIAIGVAGLVPIRDRRGEKDLFNYILKAKRTAIADELASAAELVIGQTNEAIPAAIIRGYPFEKSEEAATKDMLRPLEKELFL
jgi:coenzyme F420-0:L-glutamate ligase/coenzyme F420-1:gamma-L-glutamate ligase